MIPLRDISIEFPWPARELHPNARVHRMAKARATKRAREDAAWSVKAAGIGRIKAEALKVTAIFFPPDNRRRDLDSMLASIKGHLDGIADVIGVDDSRWQIAIRKEAPRRQGAVRIEIEVVK